MSITLTRLDSLLRNVKADENQIVKKIKELDVETPKILFADDAFHLTIKSHRITKKDNDLPTVLYSHSFVPLKCVQGPCMSVKSKMVFKMFWQ